MKYYLFAVILWCFASLANAGLVLITDTLTLDEATVTGGGRASSGSFFGIAGGSPNGNFILSLQSGDSVTTRFAGVVAGDVIGGAIGNGGFGLGVATWTITLPAVPSTYVPNTFDLDVEFSLRLGFTGNSFSAGDPNSLDFDVTFDGVSQDSQSFQAGNVGSGAVTLAGSFSNESPVSEVKVTMAFPDETNSFDTGFEHFRVYDNTLTVNYSYQAVPEPSPLLYLGLMVTAVGLRRRLAERWMFSRG